MRGVSLRLLTGVVVATLCLLGSPAGRVDAQEKAKPAEGEGASVADEGPNPAVEALLAANQEAALYDTHAATVTSSAPIIIPATGTGGGLTGVAGPYPAQITVSGLPTAIGRLEVRLNHLTHTFPADLDILLVGPGGQNVMLMSDVGGGGDVEGAFLTFSDGAPAVSATQIVSGTFSPTNAGVDALPAPAPASPHGTSLAAFIGTNPNGLWSLYVYDDAGVDVGRLYGFSLIISPLSTNSTPTAITDLSTVESSIVVSGLPRPITKVTVGFYLTHTFDGDLDISLIGPDGTAVELTSDNGGAGDNYGTACTPTGRTTFDDAAATAITAGVAPFAGSFRPEAPLTAFNTKAANGTWKLRITDDAGLDVGSLACWTLAITTTEPVQPPTALSVTNITGNVVTFRWTPSPAGPAPTSFVFEGGVTPGQVLASVPTSVPALTLSVPNGAFFVRVRSFEGGIPSGASNELPIYVNVAALPSAPSNLLLTRNGSALELTWRNTFEGAAPTGLVLDVSGSIVASLPLPVSEHFAFNGVPAGSYNFTVRAVNGAGTSAASNVRSATFPSATCVGIPAVPANFRAYRIGSTVFVDWDPPGVGAAISYYVLNVTGALAATIPTPLRALSGAVPPGTYNLTVASVNACGSSPNSAVQSVTVP